MGRIARVLCLSGHNLHPLCWSHYASNHTGICLHFATRPKSIFRGASKVLYKADREPIIIDGGPPAKDAYDKIVLTKAEFWSYEDEYRIITSCNGPMADQIDRDGFIAFPPEVLCGITLGMRINDADKRLMTHIARKRASPPIPKYQAQMDATKFWMIEERIA